MKRILFVLFCFFSSIAYSYPCPYSETNVYSVTESIEPGIFLPIADFELIDRVESHTGFIETYAHLIYPSLRFCIYHDVFSHPVGLESYGNWFTQDIDEFYLLDRSIIYGGQWGTIPIFHQVLADWEMTIHQLFVVRGYNGMGVCIGIPHQASSELECFWNKVLNDIIHYMAFD